MDTLERLKELTDKLTGYPVRTATSTGGWEEFPMEEGRMQTKDIWTIPGKVSAAVTYNSPGVFQKHRHEEQEWIICYEGHMIVTIFGDNGETTTRELKMGDFVHLDKMVWHGIRFLEHTYYLDITIPDNKFWPR
jgi:quercetin dioxygenase-like cupin family protein